MGVEWEGMKEEEKLINFLESQRKLLKNYQNEKDKDDDNLNLFSSISDAYKRENYNSDILAFILTPKAMGDKKYLEGFLKFIGLKTIEIDSFVSENNINSTIIKREENRIDILIKNEKTEKAIIIESKINGAEDQPMQLVRYYKDIREEDQLDILKIVYLTVYPKRPNLKFVKGYDEITKKKFVEIEKEIQRLLFNTFICNDEVGDFKRHFQSGYLNSKEFIDNEIILQFKKLMDKLGRGVFMNEKKLIENIFGDKTKIIDLKNLVDIYNNRNEVFCNILNERTFVKDLVKNNQFKKDGDGFYVKDSVKNDIELYFCFMGYKKKNLWTEFGFKPKGKRQREFKNNIESMNKIIEKIKTSMKENLEIKDSDFEFYIDNNWCCIMYYYKETIKLNDYAKNVDRCIEQLMKNGDDL